ncbi:Ulp1 family isopeptidase [Aestuariispira insulae]|nr:Ulp1 family isopeptidase [Aestuariispira insulae]
MQGEPSVQNTRAIRQALLEGPSEYSPHSTAKFLLDDAFSSPINQGYLWAMFSLARPPEIFLAEGMDGYQTSMGDIVKDTEHEFSEFTKDKFLPACTIGLQIVGGYYTLAAALGNGYKAYKGAQSYLADQKNIGHMNFIRETLVPHNLAMSRLEANTSKIALMNKGEGAADWSREGLMEETTAALSEIGDKNPEIIARMAGTPASLEKEIETARATCERLVGELNGAREPAADPESDPEADLEGQARENLAAADRRLANLIHERDAIPAAKEHLEALSEQIASAGNLGDLVQSMAAAKNDRNGAELYQEIQALEEGMAVANMKAMTAMSEVHRLEDLGSFTRVGPANVSQAAHTVLGVCTSVLNFDGVLNSFGKKYSDLAHWMANGAEKGSVADKAVNAVKGWKVTAFGGRAVGFGLKSLKEYTQLNQEISVETYLGDGATPEQRNAVKALIENRKMTLDVAWQSDFGKAGTDGAAAGVSIDHFSPVLGKSVMFAGASLGIWNRLKTHEKSNAIEVSGLQATKKEFEADTEARKIKIAAEFADLFGAPTERSRAFDNSKKIFEERGILGNMIHGGFRKTRYNRASPEIQQSMMNPAEAMASPKMTPYLLANVLFEIPAESSQRLIKDLYDVNVDLALLTQMKQAVADYQNARTPAGEAGDGTADNVVEELVMSVAKRINWHIGQRDSNYLMPAGWTDQAVKARGDDGNGGADDPQAPDGPTSSIVAEPGSDATLPDIENQRGSGYAGSENTEPQETSLSGGGLPSGDNPLRAPGTRGITDHPQGAWHDAGGDNMSNASRMSSSLEFEGPFDIESTGGLETPQSPRSDMPPAALGSPSADDRFISVFKNFLQDRIGDQQVVGEIAQSLEPGQYMHQDILNAGLATLQNNGAIIQTGEFFTLSTADRPVPPGQAGRNANNSLVTDPGRFAVKLAEALSIAEGKPVVVPVNVDNAHWVSLTVRQGDDGTREAHMFDSLPNDGSYTLLKSLVQQVLGQDLAVTRSNTAWQQKEGELDCGPHVFGFAQSLGDPDNQNRSLVEVSEAYIAGAKNLDLGGQASTLRRNLMANLFINRLKETGPLSSGDARPASAPTGAVDTDGPPTAEAHPDHVVIDMPSDD